MKNGVEQVVGTLNTISVAYGLAVPPLRVLELPRGAGEEPVIGVAVDAAGLSRLLAVFATSDKAEHYVLAVLAVNGDENARQVIDDMSDEEQSRFAAVFCLVSPLAQDILEALQSWADSAPVIGEVRP